MSKILLGIIAAMGSTGFLYYQFAVVPMKNKLEEQTAVIMAQDLRDQEQKATIVAIQENAEKSSSICRSSETKSAVRNSDVGVS